MFAQKAGTSRPPWRCQPKHGGSSCKGRGAIWRRLVRAPEEEKQPRDVHTAVAGCMTPECMGSDDKIKEKGESHVGDGGGEAQSQEVLQGTAQEPGGQPAQAQGACATTAGRGVLSQAEVREVTDHGLWPGRCWGALPEAHFI